MPERILIPEGAEARLIRDFHRRATADLDRRGKEAHTAFLRSSEMKSRAATKLAASFGIKVRDAEEAIAGERKRLRRYVRGAKPSRFRALKEHNPVRYAPYAFPWSYINCGGITYCSLYGPSAGSGQIGADLAIFNGGGASSGSAVGFWYYAQQSGTLYTTVQASVWGRGYVFSGLFGYASAWAALRVYVQRYSPFTTWSASANIYNNWGVLEFDIHTFDWETRTVSLAVPVVAGNWYAIWGAAYQSAYAGGVADSVSNFDLYVGPVSYFLV
ncbi:MAG: hypothetical protein M3T56_09365 [Chloroflexota bacterium]|nr:hypothetical protein [Chloroflexota bacterium]